MNKQTAVGNLNNMFAFARNYMGDVFAYSKVPSFSGPEAVHIIADSISALASDANKEAASNIKYTIRMQEPISILAAVAEDLGKAGVAVPGVRAAAALRDI